MPRSVRLLLALLLIPALSGCLNDPFGMKPEVRGVKLPEKPAETQTETPAADAPDTQP